MKGYIIIIATVVFLLWIFVGSKFLSNNTPLLPKFSLNEMSVIDKKNTLEMEYQSLREIKNFSPAIITEYNELQNLIDGKCNSLLDAHNRQFCQDFVNKKLTKDFNFSATEKKLLSANITNDRSLLTDDPEALVIFNRIAYMRKESTMPFPIKLNESKNLFFLYYKLYSEWEYISKLDALYKNLSK